MAVSFTLEETQDILTFVKQLPVTPSNSLYNPITRKYGFRIIYHHLESKWIFKRMFEYLYEQTGIEVKKPLDELYIHNYTKGDYFLRHSDVSTKIWNIGVCLNDQYEGGDFILYNPEVVLPKAPGTIYAFESQREHEVLPITSGERWSIIGFLERGHIGINKPTQLL